MRDAGKRVAFVTNDPRHAGEEFVRKLWGIGVQASLADVVTVGAAMQHLLSETRRGGAAFVIGAEPLWRHVTEAGVRIVNGTDLATRAELVVVGGTDKLSYEDLRDAVLALRRGADFLATGRDPTYPMPDGLWPGTGAILAAVEVGSGRGGRGGRGAGARDRRQAGAAALLHGARPARRRLDTGDRRPPRRRRRSCRE